MGRSVKFLAKKRKILSVFNTMTADLSDLISSMVKEKDVQVKEREIIDKEIDTLEVAINESEVLKNRIEDFINPKQDVTEESKTDIDKHED